MVAYTGKPRQHGINNWEVFKAHIGGKRAVQTSLERISEVAQEMRVAMEKPDWQEAGRLMREEWSFRKRNLPTISTKTIDRVIENARRNGALAGKVCGAGGGGCVVLLIEPHARDRMEKTIREPGTQLFSGRRDSSLPERWGILRQRAVAEPVPVEDHAPREERHAPGIFEAFSDPLRFR